MSGPPDRITWAVAGLDLRAGQRVLELGMGRGVAAVVVLGEVPDVEYVGVDRSAIAVRAAGARLQRHGAWSAVQLVHADVAALDAAALSSFDVAFAINLNAFWTGPAHAELAILRRLLEPAGGRLHLFYDPPRHARAQQIRGLAVGHLNEAGFEVDALEHVPDPKASRRWLHLAAELA